MTKMATPLLSQPSQQSGRLAVQHSMRTGAKEASIVCTPLVLALSSQSVVQIV